MSLLYRGCPHHLSKNNPLYWIGLKHPINKNSIFLDEKTALEENLERAIQRKIIRKTDCVQKSEISKDTKLRQNFYYLHDAFLTPFHALHFTTCPLLVMMCKLFLSSPCNLYSMTKPFHPRLYSQKALLKRSNKQCVL